MILKKQHEEFLKPPQYRNRVSLSRLDGKQAANCSDYVSYILSRVAKRHLALIPKESWWPVPRAYKYYEFFAALPTDAARGWRRVDRLEYARPGDIKRYQSWKGFFPIAPRRVRPFGRREKIGD